MRTKMFTSSIQLTLNLFLFQQGLFLASNRLSGFMEPTAEHISSAIKHVAAFLGLTKVLPVGALCRLLGNNTVMQKGVHCNQCLISRLFQSCYFLHSSFGKIHLCHGQKSMQTEKEGTKEQDCKVFTFTLCLSVTLFSQTGKEQINFTKLTKDRMPRIQYWPLDCWNFSCFKTSLNRRAGFQ